MPRISVIVPIYNVQDYVGECLESLKAQTFGDFEVVCVDDGSTDESLERARAAAGDDERFVFVSQENGGLSVARNTGLDRATGEYVTFLDSDDLYRADTLERLDAAASAADADLVDFSASSFYDTDGARRAHQEDYSYRKPFDEVVSGPELFVHYHQSGQYIASACFHMIRRSLLVESGHRFVDGLLHEDEVFTPILYGIAGRSVLVCEPFYQRRMREGSIMTSGRGVANVRAVFRAGQLLHAWLIEHAGGYSAEFVDAFAQNICTLRDTVHRDWTGLPGAVQDEFLASLSEQDRVDFDLTCRYALLRADARQAGVQARLDEVAGSRDYRVGGSLLALPRAVARVVRRG